MKKYNKNYKKYLKDNIFEFFFKKHNRLYIFFLKNNIFHNI